MYNSVSQVFSILVGKPAFVLQIFLLINMPLEPTYVQGIDTLLLISDNSYSVLFLSVRLKTGDEIY